MAYLENITLPLPTQSSFDTTTLLSELSPDDAAELLDAFNLTEQDLALLVLADQGVLTVPRSPRLRVLIDDHGKLGVAGKIIFDVMSSALVQLATDCVSAGNA